MNDPVQPAGRGRLFVISAPSGGGKTSLVQALRGALDNVSVSVSHTTRPRRGGETDGVAYHFIDNDEFDAMATAGEFLEHANVFDHRYGTSKTAIDELLQADIDVILEIDWQGARAVGAAGLNAVTIFIMPPSIHELEQRLRGRGDTDSVVRRRMRDAVNEMSHYAEYDYLIFNDSFQQALIDLTAVVSASRLERAAQQSRHRELLDSLVAP